MGECLGRTRGRVEERGRGQTQLLRLCVEQQAPKRASRNSRLGGVSLGRRERGSVNALIRAYTYLASERSLFARRRRVVTCRRLGKDGVWMTMEGKKRQNLEMSFGSVPPPLLGPFLVPRPPSSTPRPPRSVAYMNVLLLTMTHSINSPLAHRYAPFKYFAQRPSEFYRLEHSVPRSSTATPTTSAISPNSWISISPDPGERPVPKVALSYPSFALTDLNHPIRLSYSTSISAPTSSLFSLLNASLSRLI